MNVYLVDLALRAPFRVGKVELRSWPTVIVELGDGRGECTPLPIPGWTPAEVTRALAAVDGDALLAAPDLASALARIPSASPPVRAALDVALHDHFARRAGVAVWQLVGAPDPAGAPAACFSLGVQPGPEAVAGALSTAAGFERLKLKVGAGAEVDLAVVREVRARDPRELQLDANGAWSFAEAVRVLPALAELGVALVEQPVTHGDPEAWARLREALAGRPCPPLVADESIVEPADLERLAPHLDGVNLKLTKHGGLAPTLALMRRARALGKQVLLGCYVESSLAIAAAAQLSALADHNDLDGNLNLVDDPFARASGPGLAVAPRRTLVAVAPARRTTFDVDGTADPQAAVSYLAAVAAVPGVAAAKQRMHDLLGLQPGDSVLDVACGHGVDAIALSAIVGPTGRAVGIDRSHTLIAAARAEAERAGARVELEVGDAEALPFPDASFDAVRIERSLMHVADPARVVAELARVVRPGGRVLLAEPDWDTLLVGHPEPALTAFLRDAVVKEVAHPNIGRCLPSMAIAAGLVIRAIDAWSLALTSFEQAGTLLGLADGARDSVMAGKMPVADAMRWLGELEAADRQGAFVCTLTGLGVLATRPT